MLRSMIWMSSYSQHIYKEHQCGDVALVKVYDDLCAVASKKMTLMTLLDLSAAFDTVHHTKIMNRLERCFGVDWQCPRMGEIIL